MGFFPTRNGKPSVRKLPRYIGRYYCFLDTVLLSEQAMNYLHFNNVDRYSIVATFCSRERFLLPERIGLADRSIEFQFSDNSDTLFESAPFICNVSF